MHDTFIKLIGIIGYCNFIKIKDLILFLAGVFLGGLITSLLIGSLFYRLKKVASLGKVLHVEIKHEGRSHYFTNPKSVGESIELLLSLTLFSFLHKKQYTIHDTKRTRLFLILLLLFGICLIILAAVFLTHIILPDGTLK